MKSCKNNKSPGLDGIPYEFYKGAWDIIGDEVKEVLQCQLDRAAIIDSNRVGVTRLVPKVTGIPQVDELRPVTLLNTDYKILSKVLVKRMKPILSKIILSGQLCTVGSKNILFGVNNLVSSLLYTQLTRQSACIISLDFYKAYDRVYLGYLLEVMKKMKFGSIFCNWIRMLHHGAQTRFILKELSDIIDVSFSIRQGDPIAMLLFIIYIEPFLLFLERTLTGMSVAGIPQVLEAYCDDVNIFTSDLEDMMKVECAVQKFEGMSGAILSRNKKCKVLGLGKWKRKTNWPLQYVKAEDEIKIFGIYVRSSYKAMLKRNWEFRFSKFQNCVMSWSSKFIPSLRDRVEVLNIFALSRVYYLASIFPISKTIARKFESVLGKFLWKGWFLRVAVQEVKNVLRNGGLGLVCVQRMCNSLLASQFLRLLKSSDIKAVAHVSYWIGESLCDLLPGTDVGSHPVKIPEYYAHIESLVVFARMDELVTPLSWRAVTNKMFYNESIKSLPAPKVEIEAGVSFSRVWTLLTLPVLSSSVCDVPYMVVHNKLPTQERMFRIGVTKEQYCTECPGTQTVDADHFFCSCLKVKNVWGFTHKILNTLIGVSVSSLELINFQFPSSVHDNEVVWLLCSYLTKVWQEIYVSAESHIKYEELFGFLRFKYKMDQQGARIVMRHIPDLA